jgi:hypothetical protein
MGLIHLVAIISIIIGIYLALSWRMDATSKEANLMTITGFVCGAVFIWGVAGVIYLIIWVIKL